MKGMTPEAKARIDIDKLLTQTGWHVAAWATSISMRPTAWRFVKFPLNTGFGFADCLLYVDGKACGVIEAKKKVGAALSRVEVRSGRYAQGLPASLPAWRRPLPFLFDSAGVETHFPNGLERSPAPAESLPELLAGWKAFADQPRTDSV